MEQKNQFVARDLILQRFRQSFAWHFAFPSPKLQRQLYLMADASIQLPGGLAPTATVPLERIGGRYRILRELGRGGFGRVLLAEDDLLKRRVAVKLLRKAAQGHAAAAFLADAAFLAEARMVAKMEHPGIVSIYDVTETDDGEYCIVSRYVEGRTLRENLAERRFTFTESAKVVVGLCEALHHAHQIGVVHRDVKPANIMLAGDGRPMLLDFGLARSWSELAGEGLAVGTPGYMSPEQARGEDHLVNGRSDIFSLGAVLYEMLTGKRAFATGSVHEQLDMIMSGGPTPPRQVDSKIPKELERICLKAMHAQLRARYPMATDMAEDLRTWMAPMAETILGGPHAAQAQLRQAVPQTSPPPAATEQQSTKPRVVPRGLRAFDEGDAEFFLALVPGPRDRYGLPESLRFWKQHIESSDAHLAFRVGVLYGPSGCGKSSLVRAGLLPHCADHVSVIYHESRDSGNAARLGRALHVKFPQLDLSDSTPAGLIQKVRKGGLLTEGRKLLIVIDQSEQWLREGETPGSDEGTALLNTLRQCDGTHVQAMLLVRDDFWRGVSRLLADADVELDSSNSALVDLFEPRHAERVLESFGRAYRCLPEDPATPLSKGAREFIQQSVRSLEETHRITPVRLALFADMFRSRDWTVESLRRVGGVGGVAVTFLEESFRGPSARGPHRIHEKAARQVLQLLVPESGDVRGPACRQSTMLEISGYEAQPKSFQELLHVLDADLRLLTPVDTAETSDGQPSWQLTHDHMVPALREWLLARKADTLQGRAEIALGERAREWQQRPDPARLPSVWEWVKLRLLTKRFRWTPVELTWMHAGMKRARLWGIGCVLAAAAGGLILHESRGRDHGKELAQRVLAASPDEVRGFLSQGSAWMKWAHPDLARAAQEPITTTVGLNARLALVASEPSHVGPLAAAMLDVDAQTFGAIRDALGKQTDVPTDAFRAVLEDASATNGRKLRAFAALACFQCEDPVLKNVQTSAARWLLTSVSETTAWASLLRPVTDELSPVLKAALSSANSETERRNTALALVGLHAEDPVEIVRLLALVPTSSVPLLVNALQQHSGAVELLANVDTPPVMLSQRETLSTGRTQGEDPKPKVLSEAEEFAYAGHANTLLAGLSLGWEQKFWPCLTREADRTLRTFLLLHAAPAGAPVEILAQRLPGEKDPGIRQALLLALCGYPLSALPASLQDRVISWLRQAYPTDPDGGVHSSIATLMKRWSLETELTALHKVLPRSTTPDHGRGWWVTPSDVDMRIVTMPDGRRIAISACEVRLSDFRRFETEPRLVGSSNPDDQSAPVTELSWMDIARYCMWLSTAEGMPADQMCYAIEGTGCAPLQDVQSRAGYRMPSKIEWEVATCTAPGSLWDSGSSLTNIRHFGWFAANAGDKPRSVGGLFPNEHGLWDTMGNALEWTHGQVEKGQMLLSELMGGSYTFVKSELEAGKTSMGGVNYRKMQAGARLARSLLDSKRADK